MEKRWGKALVAVINKPDHPSANFYAGATDPVLLRALELEMTREELEKKRDELANSYVCKKPVSMNYRNCKRFGFKNGFDACLELLWPEIDKARKFVCGHGIPLSIDCVDCEKSLESFKGD